MPIITIFQESFLVSGIMCFDGCGNVISGYLDSCIKECIEKNLLPRDARFSIDAEPYGLGIHKLILSIESVNDYCPPTDPLSAALINALLRPSIQSAHDHCLTERVSALLKGAIEEGGYSIIDDSKEGSNKKYPRSNWVNIVMNVISMSIVTVFVLLFPPSILLTVGLTVLSFLTTAFTAREHLFLFFRNFRTKNFANMGTSISLGWFLSLAHTLFHAVRMPLAASFSMMFMSYIMPILLITFINGMDEIKRLILEKSNKIQLQGIKTLFPQMSETYRYYRLPRRVWSKIHQVVAPFLTPEGQNTMPSSIADVSEEEVSFIQNALSSVETSEAKKNLLEKGMIIQVNVGECFPVDCILIQGNHGTVVDASLITGEPQQNKECWEKVPAGAVNLGQPVIVYALKNSYNSTVNRLLFRANRARANTASEPVPKFIYYYSALVFIGVVASVLVPVLLSVATVPLILENVMGILFSLCPCTIAIAHELPKILSLHQRSKKGIYLRDASLLNFDSNKVDTVVFDKTGTLTTSNSLVVSFDGDINIGLWQRIYLLEKAYGRDHPLAKAIQRYYESKSNKDILFDRVEQPEIDKQNRGLTAYVQNKRLQIGSVDYMISMGINPDVNEEKIAQGLSVVCVAENGLYKGTIYIAHEVRKGLLDTLIRLKGEGKKIIMLTGDSRPSALGFNAQIKSVFAQEDIYAKQKPKDKEDFFKKMMLSRGNKLQGVEYIGDGLNDARCSRFLSENRGKSYAINCDAKSSFFTDISLNNAFNYVFKHQELNQVLQQNITQNKGILMYSTIAFLAFIISFSIVGIGVSPLISMTIMLSTTFFVLFNSYRVQLMVDNALDRVTSWPKKLLSSNVSIGLLLGASALLMSSVLIATVATGSLALPMISFTAGIGVSLSSVCSLTAVGLSSAFVLLLTTALLSKPSVPLEDKSISKNEHPQPHVSLSAEEKSTLDEGISYGKLFSNVPGRLAAPKPSRACKPAEIFAPGRLAQVD